MEYQHIGVIKKVVEKENKNHKYYTAWIGSFQLEQQVFLHPNSLINKNQVDLIKENSFIVFNTKINKTENGERLDATNANLRCNGIIMKNILSYDIPTLQFVFENAEDAFKRKLVSKIENLKQKSSKEDINQILLLKEKFPGVFLASTNSTFSEQSLVPSTSPSSFLESIFNNNTAEYNQNLFKILVEGFKSIENQEVYEQAKFLIQYNNKNAIEGYENLSLTFYQKASDNFKFKIWFEGITNLCDTTILKKKFEEADQPTKKAILKRCNSDTNGFLVINYHSNTTNKIEEVYFSGIRNKLIQELSKATETIKIAVAWFTNAELFDVLCTKLTEGINVELIIINDFINNWEHGLPFEKFINLGGKLYFSEYPSIMHHKFCIIDEKTLFNGSYNWTYFAETTNDENVVLFKDNVKVVSEFQNEFNRLKEKLAEVRLPILPFEASQITRFERSAYREYLSRDLELKAKAVKNTNILYSNSLISLAVEINPSNTEAEEYKNSIASEVRLEKDIKEVQSIVLEVQPDAAPMQIDVNPKINEKESQAPVLLDTNPLHELQQQQAVTLKSPSVPLPTNTNKAIAHTKRADKETVVYAPKGINTTINIPKVNFPSVNKPKASTVNRVSPQYPSSSTMGINQTSGSYAVPKISTVNYLYENLQLVFVLDYSTSMESSYKLYSSGQIQKVVNMIFAISKGLTSEQNIDLFLFDYHSTRITEQINSLNYPSFINDHIIKKYKMGSTNIFAPIEDVHKKYIQELGGKKNVFVVFITDGENAKSTNSQIINYFKDNPKTPIFWQFVGLGSKFDLLESLQSEFSNVSFFKLNDVQEVSNDDLKRRLLQKFPVWFEKAKLEGLIV